MFAQMFADGARVAFEVDELDDAAGERWSVLVGARVESVDGSEGTDTGPGTSRAPDGRWTVDAWAPLEGRVVNGGVRVRF